MADNREYNSKDELIKQIISEEYKMFSEVSNIGYGSDAVAAMGIVVKVNQ